MASTASDMQEERDLEHEVLLRLNQSKRLDMKISVDIT